MSVTEALEKFIRDEMALGHGSHEISRHDDLIENGIIDSMGILKLSAFMEKELGVSIKDEDLVPENFESLDALIKFVESKKK